MDLAWAVQVLLAAASIVIDRKDDFLGSTGSRNSSANFDLISSSNSNSAASSGTSHRQSRFITMAPGGFFYAGFIFGVPVSIMLPIVRLRNRDSPPVEEKTKKPDYRETMLKASYPPKTSEMNEDVENKFEPSSNDGGSSREGNDQTELGDDGGSQVNGDDNHQPRGFDGGDGGPMLDDDLVHEVQLQKLDEYFDYMELITEKCRRRIICEVAAAAEDFYPVSDIILRQLRPQAPVHPSSRSRFARFVEAAKSGFTGDLLQCGQQHPCHVGGADILDPDMLRVFQLVGRQLNVKFIDR